MVVNMRTVYVSFSKVMDVKKFVENISPLEGQFDLVDDNYILDAKSLMGILAMDFSRPMKLQIEKATEETMHAIENFIVKN